MNNFILEKHLCLGTIHLYDYDKEEFYQPGTFNQRYKTRLEDKIVKVPQQPLTKELANSFLDGKYITVKSVAPVILYRAFGQYLRKDKKTISGARPLGAFATTEFAESCIDVKLRLALEPSWMNSKMYEEKIRVPIDTILQIGKVAPVHTASNMILAGGADQVLLPKDWPDSWIIGYRKITFKQLQLPPKFYSYAPNTINDKSSLYPLSCPICKCDAVALSENEYIKYLGSKGTIYIAKYRCVNKLCNLYW